MQNLRRVGENSDPILIHLWTKVHEIADDVGSPLHFLMPFSDSLCLISFTRYSPLSFEVIEKCIKCKSLLAPVFVGGTAQIFLRQFVRATDLLPITWQSLV